MRRTPLYEAHLKAGAKMVDFAGWDMPLSYTDGIQAEHLAVRTDVGLFDVSHMGEIRVTGGGATDFLRYATLNDPARLKPGRGQYSMLPNEQGGLIDDIYVYRDDENDYLVVCNASNRESVVQHLSQLADTFEATVMDESESWALVAVQGPGSALLLTRLCNDSLTELKKNRKLTSQLGTINVDVARTGYTGEDGFELFCRPDGAEALWQSLVEAGATPCGLGSRDTLRLEAGFPLFGHEFTGDTNPLCSDYSWVVKDKEFYGREAMWNPRCAHWLVGLKLLERGIAREDYNILHDGQAIGKVSSGTISPLTREGIAMGWIERGYAEPGTNVAVEVRGNPVAATVVKPPFYSS